LIRNYFFSLEDSLPDIQEQCRNLWEKVGESYIDKALAYLKQGRSKP